MQIFDLNGTWNMRKCSTDAMEQSYAAAIPGSVLRTLLDNGAIEDPYYRDNVDPTLELLRHDYEFSRFFSVNRELLTIRSLFDIQ
ncbi:glycosyl hydrolase 2 galactose-binding domain-containing protein [Paenibacillus qinlingensis]|uniref:Beta-mannosidase-like galactose-binding domain-containing protein n=1 Tax=Paenibacillus qinlingensis TaxID=1837343 RepID=A0ABU1P581_9BACL|nr:hypothetical protein [Paenibacillus qinlingensis]MDR6554858.1 hypothetical protein [Paenibacillus qinlingensis]